MLPEATVIDAETWSAQDQPLPVYAQPFDEHELDERAFPDPDQVLHPLDPSERRNEYDSDAYDSEELENPPAVYHQMRQVPRRERRRRGPPAGSAAFEEENFERGNWRGVVVIAEPRLHLNSTAILKLGVLCFVYSCFALAMLIIHIEWLREDEVLKEKEEQLSEEEAAAKEEDEYEEDGDDDYWADRREERESQESFEVLFQFISFLVYMVIVLAQRAISNLRELYLKTLYVPASRFWISWTIFSLVTLLVLDSFIEEKLRNEEEGQGEVDWEEYDRQVDAYNAVLIINDVFNLFFFVSSTYIFHRTFLALKRQEESSNNAYYDPPPYLD